MAPVRFARTARTGSDAPRFTAPASHHRSSHHYPGVVVSARGAADVTHNDVYSNWGTMGRVSNREHGARPRFSQPNPPATGPGIALCLHGTRQDASRTEGVAAPHTRAQPDRTALSRPAAPSAGRARVHRNLLHHGLEAGVLVSSSDAAGAPRHRCRRRHLPLPPSLRLARSLCPRLLRRSLDRGQRCLRQRAAGGGRVGERRPERAGQPLPRRPREWRLGVRAWCFGTRLGHTMGRVSARAPHTHIATAHPLASPLQAAAASSATNSSGTRRRRSRWPPPPVRLPPPPTALARTRRTLASSHPTSPSSATAPRIERNIIQHDDHVGVDVTDGQGVVLQV